MQGNFIKGLVKASSPFLIFFGVLSFILLGVFVADYYADLFTRRFGNFGGLIAGICLSLIIEGGRFGFLLASVRDFAINNSRNGWLGLIASVLLVVHDLTVAWKISFFWSELNSLDYYSCFFFLIVFGLFVEVRLVMAYNKKASSTDGGEASPDSVGVSSSRSSAAGAAGS